MMAQNTTIEWTQFTWNPTTGCTKVSPGCKNCYAESLAKRLQAMGVNGYDNGFELSILPERLIIPLRRKTPTIFFVNSMSDLFHEDIPDGFIEQVFDVIFESDRHLFQILTKRAERMADFFSTHDVPPNAWLGVSVEDWKYGVPRIDILRNIPAQMRFLSVEPLLEDLGAIDLSNIHWVIVGGESGIHARPMEKAWAENIQSQCQVQDVAFFFKQWGKWGEDGKKRSKKKNGRLLNGQLWEEMPTY